MFGFFFNHLSLTVAVISCSLPAIVKHELIYANILWINLCLFMSINLYTKQLTCINASRYWACNSCSCISTHRPGSWKINNFNSSFSQLVYDFVRTKPFIDRNMLCKFTHKPRFHFKKIIKAPRSTIKYGPLYPGPRGFLSPLRDEIKKEKEAARENLW